MGDDGDYACQACGHGRSSEYPLCGECHAAIREAVKIEVDLRGVRALARLLNGQVRTRVAMADKERDAARDAAAVALRAESGLRGENAALLSTIQKRDAELEDIRAELKTARHAYNEVSNLASILRRERDELEAKLAAGPRERAGAPDAGAEPAVWCVDARGEARLKRRQLVWAENDVGVPLVLYADADARGEPRLKLLPPMVEIPRTTMRFFTYDGEDVPAGYERVTLCYLREKRGAG